MTKPLFQPSRASAWTLAAAILVTGLAAPSCKQLNEKLSGKSQAKCDRGLQIARVALKQGNFPLVQQWRTYSYKHCPDTSEVQKLDQEITAKQQEIKAREAKNARAKQIIGLFKNFAEKQAANPTGHCYPKEDPQVGWCTKTQQIKGADSTFTCRYRDEEKDWIRFDTTVPGEVKCADMGAVPVRRWKVKRPSGAVAKRTRCQIRGGGAINNYHVLISVEPTGSTVTLFSSKTMMKDNALRQRVEKEGL